MKWSVPVVLFGVGLLAAAFPRIAAYGLLHPFRRDASTRVTEAAWANLRAAGIDARPFDLEDEDGAQVSGFRFRPLGVELSRTVVYLHGIADCGLSGLSLAAPLAARGIELVVIDLRAHGRSGGSCCTFGVLEKRTVSRVVDSLTSPDWSGRRHRVGVFGTSLGAAVAIQAAARDPRIDALVAQSAFTDLKTIAHDYVARLTGVRWPWLCDRILDEAEKIGRFRIEDVSPIEAIARVRCPILLVTGEADAKISPEYSRRIFDAATCEKRLLILPGAGHDDVFVRGGRQYLDLVADFFATALR